MKSVEEQLNDNSNRIALMASILAGGILAASRGDVDGQKTVTEAVGLALAIQQEVNKVAAQVRSEL